MHVTSGPFYSSTVTIRDIRIESVRTGKPPVIPVATVMHSTKQQRDHEMAWMVIIELIPELM